MNKLFNTSLILLLSFVMTAGMLTACDKDDDDDGNSGKVELLSFGPSGVRHGDTISFIGKNLTQVTTIQLTGATVEKTGFIQQTPELITIKVPNATVRGLVTLKTATGDITSKTPLDLEVPVKITSVTAQARPGENITIKGEFLNWVTSVTFGLNKKVETFVSKTLTELVVKVPLDAQTDKLSLSTGGTEPLTIITDNVLIVTLPAATGFAPNPVKHQTNLTITGTDLDLVKQILFTGGDTVTSFVSQAATQLVVKVPSKTKKGIVTLVAASGVKTVSTGELDVVLPAVTTMTPNPVDIGAELTVTGTNLDLVSSIKFPGVATAVTTFISKTANQIVLTVPAGTVKGKLTLSVMNSTSSVQTADDLTIVGGSTEVPFTLLVYGDDFNSNWEKWGGWGTASQDAASTEQVKAGTKAIKVNYSATDSYGAVQLHPKTNFPFPGAYSTLRLSIYGGANATATSRIAIYMKDATDPTDAQKKVLTLVPGTYTTYEIPLTAFSNNPVKINEFVIQNYGTASLGIYIDEIGFY